MGMPKISKGIFTSTYQNLPIYRQSLFDLVFGNEWIALRIKTTQQIAVHLVVFQIGFKLFDNCEKYDDKYWALANNLNKVN